MALTVDQIASYYPNSLYQTGNIGFSEAEVTRYLSVYQNVDRANPVPTTPVNGTILPRPPGYSHTPVLPTGLQSLWVTTNFATNGVFANSPRWSNPRSLGDASVLNGELGVVMIYKNAPPAIAPVGGTPTSPPPGWSLTQSPLEEGQVGTVVSYRITVFGEFVDGSDWGDEVSLPDPEDELILGFASANTRPTQNFNDILPIPTDPNWRLFPSVPTATETTYISVRPLMTDVGEFIPNSVWSTPQDVTTIPDDLGGTASFSIVRGSSEIPSPPEVGDVIWINFAFTAQNGTDPSFNFLLGETYRWSDQERWDVFRVPTTAFSQPSNIRKIISATHDAFYSTAQTYLNTLSSFIDFSGLEAEALNVFGEIWGVARPTFTTLNADVDINDELYRQLIHAVILSRFGGNTYSSLYILARAIELDRFIISINIEGGAVLDASTLLDASTRLLGVNALGQGSIQIRYSGVLPTANLQVRNFFATDSSTGKSRFSSFLSLLFEPILATGIDLDLRLEGT